MCQALSGPLKAGASSRSPGAIAKGDHDEASRSGWESPATRDARWLARAACGRAALCRGRAAEQQLGPGRGAFADFAGWRGVAAVRNTSDEALCAQSLTTGCTGSGGVIGFLLPNAELTEDRVEQILGGSLADDFAHRVDGRAKI